MNNTLNTNTDSILTTVLLSPNKDLYEAYILFRVAFSQKREQYLEWWISAAEQKSQDMMSHWSYKIKCLNDAELIGSQGFGY
jgi:hypothetical protein